MKFKNCALPLTAAGDEDEKFNRRADIADHDYRNANEPSIGPQLANGP